MTYSIVVGSDEACREINVHQSIEDFVHHNQAAVMTTLLQCWPLEVAQHCSDATVGVVVASHVTSCVSLNLFQLVDVLAGRWIPDSGGILELGSDVCFVSQVANTATARTQVAVQKCSCTSQCTNYHNDIKNNINSYPIIISNIRKLQLQA